MKIISDMFHSTKKQIEQYLSRRPHHSFRRTRRRDYVRSLKLPGYFAFNRQVKKILLKNRNTFILLAIVYSVISVVMVGLASQDLYSTIKDTLDATSGNAFNGVLGELGKVGLLLATGATGGFSQTLTESQQIYAGLILLLTWMTTVWLLRNIMAGHKVKLRDGLYNAGAPLLSTFLVSLLLIVQLLPIALAFIGYSAASATGLLDGGAATMLFWIVETLLVVVSLYFITSTIFAMIIVTLPGMYPYKAIKTAGDLVIGRRLRILYRLLWLGLCTSTMWILIMVPVILIDSWLKRLLPAISWLPLVPLALLLLGALTVIWASSYVYMLYRKVVADESEPA